MSALMSTVTITQARMSLYNELTDAGKLYVDVVALQLEGEITKRNRKAFFGPGGARELAMAVLQSCWSGCLPEYLDGHSTN